MVATWVPLAVRERVCRVQEASIRCPNLNGVLVDEAVLDGVVLPDNADSRAECGGSRNAVGWRDPVFQRERGAVLEELVLRIHPVTLTVERGRPVVRVESNE